MKKIIIYLSVLFILFASVGCSTKPVEEQVAGGWQELADTTLTSEVKEIFNKAVEGTKYAGLVPSQLLATQVVAGTNYLIKCEDGSEVIVYQDLQGNCFALNEDYSIIEKEASSNSKGCDISEDCNDNKEDTGAIGVRSDMSSYESYNPDTYYVFVNSNVKEMAKDMADGKTFVTYFGFAGCPWCKDAMPILNNVANELGVEYINYVNTRANSEWKSNLDIDDYDLLVEIAGEHLPLDDDNVRHLYVPTVFFVKDGEIVKVVEHTDYDARITNIPESMAEEYRQSLLDAFNLLIVR